MAKANCKICETEVAKVSTLKYISDEKHHAKCSFGYLSRLEIQEACQNPKYQNEDDKSFVDLYLGLWNIKSDQIQDKYAFALCNNGHIVGFIEDNSFYLSDVSEVDIFYPKGVKTEWVVKYWENNYREAIIFQTRLNQEKLYDLLTNEYDDAQKTENFDIIKCELCFRNFNCPALFAQHRQTKSHKDMVE